MAAQVVHYTVVVGHSEAVVPRYFVPKRAKLDKEGKPIPSKFGINQVFDEECPRAEIHSQPITKWTTPKADLDSLSGTTKKLVNELKSFLVDFNCALWYHNANCDGMSEFGGRHFHLVLSAPMGTNGPVKQLFDSRKFKNLKTLFDDNNGYIRSQRVRYLDKLCKHLNTEPRVFMGSKSSHLVGVVHQLFEDGSTDTVEWNDCVSTEEMENEDSVAGPSGSSWDIDPPSTASTTIAGHKRPCEQNQETQVAKKLSTDIRAPSDGDTGRLDILNTKLTPGDKTINIVKQLCLKYDAWSHETLSDIINNLPADDIVRIRWATFQHRPGLSQKIMSIAQEMRCGYRSKSWDTLLQEFADEAHLTLDNHMNIFASIECLQKWLELNNQSPKFFGMLRMLMDKKHHKKNCLTVVGPSNSGKTVVIGQPLAKICKFVGRVSNVNTAGNFAWENCVNCRLISVDEALFAPEHLDKYKQISGGESCIVDKKYSAPVQISRTPVVLTANVPPWRTNANEKVPLENRCWYIHTREATFMNAYQDLTSSLNPIAYYFCNLAYLDNDQENFWEAAKHYALEWMSVAALKCHEESEKLSDTDDED